MSFQAWLSVVPAPHVARALLMPTILMALLWQGGPLFSHGGAVPVSVGVGYGHAHSLLLDAIGSAVAGWSQPPPYPWIG